jgi:hypothetical protein
MAETPQYPLEQVLKIKKQRFDEAVKTLEAKKAILEKSYEKLFDLTQELEIVAKHKADKLSQIRNALDEGTSSDKIQQMKLYLQTVNEKFIVKKKGVDAQQKIVDNAQKEVDLATDDLFQKKKDLEKLELHKKEWEKQASYSILRKEESDQDEQGSNSFNRLARDKTKQKRDNLHDDK